MSYQQPGSIDSLRVFGLRAACSAALYRNRGSVLLPVPSHFPAGRRQGTGGVASYVNGATSRFFPHTPCSRHQPEVVSASPNGLARRHWILRVRRASALPALADSDVLADACPTQHGSVRAPVAHLGPNHVRRRHFCHYVLLYWQHLFGDKLLLLAIIRHSPSADHD
jgi:hypothetical protein